MISRAPSYARNGRQHSDAERQGHEQAAGRSEERQSNLLGRRPG
jgi:hypothetical protein